MTTSEGKKLEVIKLDLKEILYFEYIKSKRKIRITCGREWYEFSYVIEKLAEELIEYGFEINCRGNLVNMRHIRKVKGFSVYIDNGKELPVSQRRRADFIKKVNVFMNDRFN